MVALKERAHSNNAVKTKIHVEDALAPSKLASDLSLRLEKHDCENPRVLLCIGTDRSTGDCLGPLVGSKIDRLQQDFFEVYGTLNNPVHASNLKDTLEKIHNKYNNPLIIAVDACLGRIENVGCINLGDGSLRPGAGVSKSLPPVGQIHITGIVNVGGFMEYMVLQNTRLNIVMRLADTIANGLSKVIAEYSCPQSARGC
ncbi:MAG: spore protease YyaC [Desulfotomaculaceae bacterium]|nr:spore protease YyaC [Desulfotomaculaceae bacterium]MDD4767927.1 spore protease YyaC [Desulfotomaculaceae bacterium]